MTQKYTCEVTGTSVVGDQSFIVLRPKIGHDGEPFADGTPENITLAFDGHRVQIPPRTLVTVTLGKQPLPERKPLKMEIETEHPAPLHKDRIVAKAHNVRLTFVRASLPNPNHYNVLYGETDVGFIRLLNGKWRAKVCVVDGRTLEQFEDEDFATARKLFCKHIDDLLNMAEIDGGDDE